MCGIFASIHNTSDCTESYVKTVTEKVSKLLQHRGPDNTNYSIINCHSDKSIIMIHTRLHIVGDSTPQPLTDESGEIHLIINGEIFNWKELAKELNYTCNKSDCEVIIPLYKKYIRKSLDFTTFFEKINGQFSFVLYDSLNNHIFVSRDHIGITPLYYGYDEDKIAFCSEMKGLTMNVNNKNNNSFTSTVKTFYPRTYLYTNINDCTTHLITGKTNYYLNYYELNTSFESKYDNYQVIKQTVNKKLQQSISSQLNDLMNDNSPEYGVLLSGGLDSSLVASIVSKLSNKKVKTFSIGMTPNSTDLIASRRVAKFLDTDHHEFYFTAQEGINSLRDVIWYTETYDTTTIRAGTAMYLLTKKIKEKFPNIKVLFSGELSDEMLSYLYGGNAPT